MDPQEKATKRKPKKPSASFSLDVGDRVELLTIDSLFDRTGKFGTVSGFGISDMRDGRECYWIRMDGHRVPKKYSINYLLICGTEDKP